LNIPVRRKIVLSFTGAMAVLSVLFMIGTLSLKRLQDSYVKVSHSYEVIARIRLMEADLHETQAGLRGCLLTQQPAFLETAKTHLSLIGNDAFETARLTVDNPRQRESLEELRPLLAETAGRIQENIRLCSRGHLREALKLFRSGSLSQDNQRLQAIINQMVREEQTLLLEREKTVSGRARFALVMFIFGCVFFMLFFLAAMWLINREIRQKEAFQKNLQLEEYRLFQFLEAVPLGIFVAKKTGQPYYANRQAENLLGKGILPNALIEDQAKLYRLFRAGTGEIFPTEQLPLVRAIKGEKTMTEDIEIHQPNGTVVPVQTWGTPVVNPSGEIQYAMVVFNDITERKQGEEMKHNLISVVSHQLKTPVAEINGYIENMLDGITGELGKKQRTYLSDMREIGLNNYRLLSDLLNISKIERGLLSSDPQKISLLTIVSGALRDYEKSVEKKGLTLTLEGIGREWEVMADPDKLIETLRNVVSNAIKFTDKGGITLTAEKVGSFVHLKIQDTGSGISDASLAQLFSRKMILGTESSRAGAGLGLYVAKTFMKLQGGDITASTEKGKGSCFTLIIPSA